MESHSDRTHETSSPARTLGFCFPLKARVSEFDLCTCFPVYVTALRRADPRPESQTDCCREITLNGNSP
jgi:hypothetical protein